MQVGIKMGERYSARLTLLHVYPALPKYSSELLEKSSLDNLNELKNNLIKICSEMSEESGLDISYVLLTGNVEDQLLTFVKEHPFDMVIMGVNSSSEDNSPGSHTAMLIEHSSAPVLVVPNSYSLND